MLIKIHNDFITIKYKFTNKNIIKIFSNSISLLDITLNERNKYAEIKQYFYFNKLKLVNFLQFNYIKNNISGMSFEQYDFCFKPIYQMKNNDVTTYYGDIYRAFDENYNPIAYFTIDNINYYERNCKQLGKLVNYINANQI